MLDRPTRRLAPAICTAERAAPLSLLLPAASVRVAMPRPARAPAR